MLLVMFKFTLETKCIDGIKAKVKVTAGGPIVTGGMPFSLTHSREVTFNDNLSTPDPFVFEGSAKFGYASWAIGFGGFSWQKIVLGGASTQGGGFQMGYDASVASGAGISYVDSSKIEKCECE